MNYTKIILLLSIPGLILGYDTIPPLKWVKSIQEIAVTPTDLLKHSPDEVLCTDNKQIIILNKVNGATIKKSTEIGNFASIEKASDNGYIIAKGNSIVFLNHELEIVWSKTLIDNAVSLVSVSQTSDSGFVALGNNKVNQSVHVIKTDKNGDTLWTRTNIKSSDDILTYTGVGVREIEDGYVVCQSYCSGICVWQNALFAKYSVSGAEQWTGKFYGFTVKDMISVNGRVLFTGEYDSNAEPDLAFPEYSSLAKRQYFVPTDIYYLQLGADGKILKNLSVDGGLSKSWGNSIKQYKNNSIIAGFVTYTNPLINKVIISMVTETGNSKSLKDYIIPHVSSVYPIALPFVSGELLVFTKDSLYYYEHPTNIHSHRVEQHLNQTKQVSLLSSHKSINYLLSSPVKLKIDLLSYNGRLIQCVDQGMKTAGTHVITTKDLAPGIYFLRFQYGNRKNVYRIVQGR